MEPTEADLLAYLRTRGWNFEERFGDGYYATQWPHELGPLPIFLMMDLMHRCIIRALAYYPKVCPQKRTDELLHFCMLANRRMLLGNLEMNVSELSICVRDGVHYLNSELEVARIDKMLINTVKAMGKWAPYLQLVIEQGVSAEKALIQYENGNRFHR